MIDLPSLEDFMVGTPEPEQPANGASPPPTAPVTTPLSDNHPEKPKRHRRSKAEIEAARAAGEAVTSHRKKADSTESTSQADAPSAPADGIPEQLEFLNDGTTPSPYTPEHAEAAAHDLGYQSAEQRERILSAESEDRPGSQDHYQAKHDGFPRAPLSAPPEDVPDATDAQVLVDEIHLLRDDLRELAGEVRKLALAVDRFREEENARYIQDLKAESLREMAEASGAVEAPKSPAG